MDYIVVQAGTISDLQSRVNGWIQDGYVPLGGIAVFRPSVNGPVMYLQSVYEKDSEPKLLNYGRMSEFKDYGVRHKQGGKK